MILNQTFVLWSSLHQHCIVSPFRLSFPSISCALLYKRTPHITTAVPRPDKNVTGFPNRRTDSHISKARFPVLATLQKVSFVIRNIWEKHWYKFYGWKHSMQFLTYLWVTGDMKSINTYAVMVWKWKNTPLIRYRSAIWTMYPWSDFPVSADITRFHTIFQSIRKKRQGIWTARL